MVNENYESLFSLDAKTLKAKQITADDIIKELFFQSFLERETLSKSWLIPGSNAFSLNPTKWVDTLVDKVAYKLLTKVDFSCKADNHVRINSNDIDEIRLQLTNILTYQYSNSAEALDKSWDEFLDLAYYINVADMRLIY